MLRSLADGVDCDAVFVPISGLNRRGSCCCREAPNDFGMGGAHL